MLGRNTEKEQSTGSILGYILLGFGGLLLVAFVAFVIVTAATGGLSKDKKTTNETETSASVERCVDSSLNYI